MKTREEARGYFKNLGLKYGHIGSIECFKLIEYVREELRIFNVEFEAKEGHLIELWVRWRKGIMIPNVKYKQDGSIQEFYIHCKGTWFDKREAISFNKDGFIGFAGWASDKNALPFTEAFVRWCDWMVARQAC